jgi:hypothetical protein
MVIKTAAESLSPVLSSFEKKMSEIKIKDKNRQRLVKLTQKADIRFNLKIGSPKGKKENILPSCAYNG